jgi:hypothetical protein
MRKKSILYALICSSILVACIDAYNFGPAHAGLVCEETVYNSNLVRAIQTKLRDEKIAGVRVDGNWSERTQKGISAYQKLHKLQASGEVDEDTFRSMFGKERSYEPVAQRVRNPHGAPEEMYREFCRR